MAKKSPAQLYEEFKTRGNDLVKQQDYKKAREFYSQCIQIDPAQSTAYLNRSLCYLKLNEPESAIEDSSYVLDKEPDNVKALYRRALANKMLSRLDQALSDLERLLVAEPKNQMALDELMKIRDEINKNQAQKQPTTTNKPNRRPPVEKFEPVKIVPTKIYDFSNITNGYEFLQAWNSIKPDDLDNYARLLENVTPSELPKYIGSKLDDNMFSALVRALERIDESKKASALVYLRSLGNVQRFSIIKMFMDKSIKDTIGRMVAVGGSDCESVKKLYDI